MNENNLEHLSQLSRIKEELLDKQIGGMHKRNNILKIAAAVLTVFTIGTITYASVTYPRVQTVTSTSPVCNIAGLVVPSDDAINVFLQKVVPKTFSFDFKNYRLTLNQLTDRYFNEKGKGEFLKALDDSNNLKSVLDSKLILTTEISAPPKITAKTEDAMGYLHWQTETPVKISFVDPKKGASQERPFKLFIDLIQSTVSGEQIDGILINGFVLAPDESPISTGSQ